MKRTTLCYITMEGRLLMLHRTKKENDENAGKYIGLGGHFLPGETPQECVRREVREESGLLPASFDYRGIVHFSSDVYEDEDMYLFTAEVPAAPLGACDEGDLCLITKEELLSLDLWEGDRIFLSLLFDGADVFDLSLQYRGETLVSATLDGRPAELLEVLDQNDRKTGRLKERSLVHRDGDPHETVHTWIYSKRPDGGVRLLLQKRADNKDAFPGRYDISSAGHVSYGDTRDGAAARELCEELGVKAKDGELVFIGYYDHFTEAVFNGRPFLDREHSALYLFACREEELNVRIVISPEEVKEVRWFDADELLRRVNDEAFCLKEEELLIVLDAIDRCV